MTFTSRTEASASRGATASLAVESKVPAATLGFWLIKILATTLGETAGDAVTMSLGLGYLVGTAIFAAICRPASKHSPRSPTWRAM